MKIEYPKFKYHKELGAKIVHSKEEESALEGKWHDTPAAFADETSAEVEAQSPKSHPEVTEKPVLKHKKTKKDAE